MNLPFQAECSRVIDDLARMTGNMEPKPEVRLKSVEQEPGTDGTAKTQLEEAKQELEAADTQLEGAKQILALEVGKSDTIYLWDHMKTLCVMLPDQELHNPDMVYGDPKQDFNKLEQA
jgi:hypothetical protein